MDCPNCHKPMKLLRERYTGHYRVHGEEEDREADFSEHTCAKCQIGIHAFLEEGKAAR